MNVENLKRNYPFLIDYLRSNGYTRGYIGKFTTDINQILENASDPGINSYEEYYYSIRGKYTKSTLYHKLKIIGKIKQFDVKGIFPTSIHRCGFLKPNNYDGLSFEYKHIIDFYVKSAITRGVSESYIRHQKCAAAKFFNFQQNRGAYSLIDISESSVQRYFHDGNMIVRGVDVMKQIRNLLNECIPHYPQGECERVISFLPRMKKRHKVYPYLVNEELKKIKSVLLDDDCTDLCLRDKAIVTIAFYTGLRGCDIAALTFDNIDWENNIIRLIQNKTGGTLSLPLRPIVGNVILDYVTQERPYSASRTIFLTRDKQARKLRATSIYNATAAVFEIAGVRGKGAKMGSHLFRHNFAVSLLQKGTQSSVISEILGHASSKSIEPYLESNLISLKERALSIEKYPVGKEVLGL